MKNQVSRRGKGLLLLIHLLLELHLDLIMRRVTQKVGGCVGGCIGLVTGIASILGGLSVGPIGGAIGGGAVGIIVGVMYGLSQKSVLAGLKAFLLVVTSSTIGAGVGVIARILPHDFVRLLLFCLVVVSALIIIGRFIGVNITDCLTCRENHHR